MPLSANCSMLPMVMDCWFCMFWNDAWGEAVCMPPDTALRLSSKPFRMLATPGMTSVSPRYLTLRSAAVA
ncbi:hypothetical protein D3C81_2143340 [compost metagenome]